MSHLATPVVGMNRCYWMISEILMVHHHVARNIHKKIRYLENIARRNICHAKTKVLVIVEVTVPQLFAMLTSDDHKSLYKAIHLPTLSKIGGSR